MPREFKRLKRNYRGRKKGDVFSTSKNNSDLGRVRRREAYLHELIRERTTYDINDIRSKLVSETRSTIRTINDVESKLHKFTAQSESLRAKLDIIGEVIGILKEIQSSGRTRVGESELRNIVKAVIKGKGIELQSLDLEVL